MRVLLASFAVASVIASGVVGSACVLDADGFTGGEAPDCGCSADAGVSADGATTPPSDGDAPALDGGADAGPNLLVNGDFELGCAGWEVSFGSIAPSSEARNGVGSCKYCLGTNFEASLSQRVAVDAGDGETWYGEVWVRGAEDPGAMASKGYVGGHVHVFANGGADGPITKIPPISLSWQKASALYKLTSTRNVIGINLQIQQTGNPAPVGDVICVYVDDAVLKKL